MIMIIGGAYQGKYNYAKQWVDKESEWIDGADCDYEEIFTCRAVNHFHLFIKRFMESNKVDELPDCIIKNNPNLVIVSDELGYGVVPVEESDRSWREKTGRISTRLAANAKEVHRIICGIGMVIKHA